jgi:hypothetical protein
VRYPTGTDAAAAEELLDADESKAVINPDGTEQRKIL